MLRTNRLVEESEEHVRQVIAAKDIQSAKKLESQLSSMAFELQGQDISFWVGAVYYLNESFDEIKWTDGPRHIVVYRTSNNCLI